MPETRPRPTRPILIAGPTASGKSALALALAARCNGVVINADSMQVYAELHLLTARPSPHDLSQAPHVLYGHVAAAAPYSVAHWLEDVEAALANAAANGLTPIITGGTGLYFKALLEGLSPIPPVPPELRQRWRELARNAAPGELHHQLERLDPPMAARLNANDTQRLTRALEVIDATGRSLADWQQMPGLPLLDPSGCTLIAVRPQRAELHARCDRRFDAMMRAGALDEVRALVALALAPDAVALKALGVPPLAAHLRGELSCEDAVALAKLQTRQYVKRQETWLNRNMSTWNIVQNTESCDSDALHDPFIDER